MPHKIHDAKSSALLSFFQKAAFLTSAAKVTQCPADKGREVAFVGRSNAGKSSALNKICHQTRLAKTSKTPGRTQLLNFFALSEQQYLVDLPGYGYAKVPNDVKKAWQEQLGRYLESRESLVGLVVLMDIRHPLTPFDQSLLDWAEHYQKPLHVLLTKADKLSRGPAKNTLLHLEKVLKTFSTPASAQLFSAVTGEGLDAAREQVAHWLGFDI